MIYGLMGLALIAIIGGLALKNIVIVIFSAGAWALLGFYSYGLSTSPSPAQITDVYMGLFWLAMMMTIASMFLGIYLRPRKEDKGEDIALIDDTAETEKEFDEIRQETRVPRIGKPRIKRRWTL